MAIVGCVEKKRSFVRRGRRHREALDHQKDYPRFLELCTRFLAVPEDESKRNQERFALSELAL